MTIKTQVELLRSYPAIKSRCDLTQCKAADDVRLHDDRMPTESGEVRLECSIKGFGVRYSPTAGVGRLNWHGSVGSLGDFKLAASGPIHS